MLEKINLVCLTSFNFRESKKSIYGISMPWYLELAYRYGRGRVGSIPILGSATLYSGIDIWFISFSLMLVAGNEYVIVLVTAIKNET